MIACFVKPWIQIVLQQFTAYVLGVQDDKMTPADTGRNSWPVMADQKWSTMKNSHDSVLNMSPKMPTIYQIDVGGTTMGPWVFFFWRNPSQYLYSLYMWMFQVWNLISSEWTKSYTCSHRLIPHFGNCFWTVFRISPSQSPKISPPSSLASTKSPLFQHARRFGKISQEARGKHCHWLVSWRLLGKIVPWAVLTSLRPQKRIAGAQIVGVSRWTHWENRPGRFG